MLKKLVCSIREYKKESILTPVFAIIEVILEIMIPFVMAIIIDEGITGKQESTLINMSVLLVICVVLGIVFGILSGKYGAKAASGFAKNIRQDMYYKIQEYSFANIDKFSTSSIVTRLTTDVTNVQNAYMMIIRVAVRAPIMLIFSLLASCLINFELSMIFLGAIFILGIGLTLIVHFSHEPFERVFRIYDKLNTVVQENVSGIRVVKSFVREDFEKKKFGKVSTSIYKTFTKAEKIVAYNMPLMQLVIYLCMLLLCWIGAQLIVSSQATTLTTGELTSMIAYAMQILNCLMMLSMVFVMINMARASLERVVEVLDEKSDLENGSHPITTIEDGEITFSNVTFGYQPGKACLEGLDFTIASGSTLGIIGSTGSGKTSLVQLICRLYDTSSGQVFVGGRNVKDYDLITLRNGVAMVLQKNELFSGTIKENLRWGKLDASDQEMKHACLLAQAGTFIKELPDQYDTYIEQGGTNVSGGQKQRLCIARALLKKPKILILDDSTSAVDTKTESLIKKAFNQEIPDITKIIIGQRISSIEDADTIIVMDQGKMNGIGSHQELLKTNTIYQEIYASQKKGEDSHEKK